MVDVCFHKEDERTRPRANEEYPLIGVENTLKVTVGDSCTTLSILKNIELYTLNG